jgi:hypothetical protein
VWSATGDALWSLDQDVDAFFLPIESSHPFDCFSHSHDNELARQTISQSQGGDTMGISPSLQREWRPNGQLKQPIQKVGHPSAPPNKPGM